MSQTNGPEEDPFDLVPVRGPMGLALELPEIEAAALQNVLEWGGIEAIRSPFTDVGLLPVRLLVPASQAEEAARIIAEALESGAASAEEAELAGEVAGDQSPEDAGKGLPGVF